MTPAPRQYSTGIESSTAILPEPPAFWSYSSLREITACPRRYALSRAADLAIATAGQPCPRRAAPGFLEKAVFRVGQERERDSGPVADRTVDTVPGEFSQHVL